MLLCIPAVVEATQRKPVFLRPGSMWPVARQCCSVQHPAKTLAVVCARAEVVGEGIVPDSETSIT